MNRPFSPSHSLYSRIGLELFSSPPMIMNSNTCHYGKTSTLNRVYYLIFIIILWSRYPNYSYFIARKLGVTKAESSRANPNQGLLITSSWPLHATRCWCIAPSFIKEWIFMCTHPVPGAPLGAQHNPSKWPLIRRLSSKELYIIGESEPTQSKTVKKARFIFGSFISLPLSASWGLLFYQSPKPHAG